MVVCIEFGCLIPWFVDPLCDTTGGFDVPVADGVEEFGEE